MIRFFRRIRKQLLSENSLRKYLVYAMGEILLVMLGILLALQVSNWNQNRADRNDERIALANLKEDFEFNRTAIKSIIDETVNVVEACVLLINHTGNKYTPAHEINVDSLLLQTINSYKFYPQNGFLDDLINSGNLDIIQEVQLRNLLSSWKPLIEHNRLLEAISTDFNVRTVEYLIAHGNFLRADEKYAPAHLQLPKSGFDRNNDALLQDITFENRIDNQIIYQDYKLIEQRKIMKACDDILGLIQKELDRFE